MWFIKKNDINCLFMEFEKLILEQNEDYLDFIKNQEEAFIERTLVKYMKHFFAKIFEVA